MAIMIQLNPGLAPKPSTEIRQTLLSADANKRASLSSNPRRSMHPETMGDTFRQYGSEQYHARTADPQYHPQNQHQGYSYPYNQQQPQQPLYPSYNPQQTSYPPYNPQQPPYPSYNPQQQSSYPSYNPQQPQYPPYNQQPQYPPYNQQQQQPFPTYNQQSYPPFNAQPPQHSEPKETHNSPIEVCIFSSVIIYAILL